MQHFADEKQELHPQRLVETKPHDGLRPLGLVGIRREQDIDRVADQKYAKKNQHCHHKDDKKALTDAPDQEGQHQELREGLIPLSEVRGPSQNPL